MRIEQTEDQAVSRGEVAVLSRRDDLQLARLGHRQHVLDRKRTGRMADEAMRQRMAW